MVNIKEISYGHVSVIQRSDYTWGVIDSDNNIIVPFGKYEWVDGFDHGLCRVRSKGATNFANKSKYEACGNWDDLGTEKDVKPAKWGIINEAGEEVLPVEYDEIWNFCGKGRFSTKVVKEGKTSEVFFHDLNPNLPVRRPKATIVEDKDDTSKDYFDIGDCYDYEGNFDYNRLEDAILDGEYVPEDW